MKVKDLIERLSECNPEATVAVPYPESSFDVPLNKVTTIRCNVTRRKVDGCPQGLNAFPDINLIYSNQKEEVVYLSGLE